MRPPALMSRTQHAAAATTVAIALLAMAWPSQAARQIVIYRCTDAGGALTVQNDTPCAPGLHQQVQHIDPPPPLPSYQSRESRMPAIVAEERARREEAIVQARPESVPEDERAGPPPLYQCTTWDKETYFTEDDTPQTRCAPLQTVGLNGDPRLGAGSACETRRDTCQAVAEDALCSTWRQRVDEAEFRWKFARADQHDPRRIEYERLAATLANSTCPE